MAFCVIAFLGNLEKGDNNAIWRFSFSPGGCSEGARKGGADTFHHQVGCLLKNYINLLLFSQERRDAERASRAEGATTQLGAPGRHGGGQPRGRGARRGQGGVGDRLACRLLVHLVPSSHLGTWWEWLACLSVLPGMLENVVLWKKHILII